MIQLIAKKYQRFFGWVLFLIFITQLLPPAAASAKVYPIVATNGNEISVPDESSKTLYPSDVSLKDHLNEVPTVPSGIKDKLHLNSRVQKKNSGPITPESASFKSIGSDNLVNLFTGDFSYSIPLMDVGGYPINLFYNSGITMEQEASWVGLGWNINPGTVTRNMRGIPDDFDGTDTLVQQQNVKPNRTWGGEVGMDLEALGKKNPGVNVSLGFSYNNYLGPELTLGAGSSIALASIKTAKSEKAPEDVLAASLGLNVKLSSHSGFTMSPSLSANLALQDNLVNTGIGLNTSYNSRSGIKNLNLFSEMSYFTRKEETRENSKRKGKTNQTSIKYNLTSSSISFSKPSYMPSIRMPMLNTTYSGQLDLGAGVFGLRGAATASGFYTESIIPKESQVQYKPLVGYIYLQKAIGNKNYVMDFNRQNDGEVTPNTPIISVPEYTYDIFTIQGEGTGGTIRAYRSDIGFVRDNETKSKDKSNSFGLDIAPVGHFGGNWNGVSTPTRVGGWDDANNLLGNTLAFKGPENNSGFENVYFRNPGESNVSNPQELERTGKDNLVRFQLSGSKMNPRVEPKLEQFSKTKGDEKGVISLVGKTSLNNRPKRTQVISMLSASEASIVGLEKQIRNYTGAFNAQNNLEYTGISRVSDYRKPNHISEISVTEVSGMRYIYGIPVYNTIQKDFTFSTSSLPTSGNIVTYNTGEAGLNSKHVALKSKIDGYVQIQETPAYASAFLLTGLLSPDYSDLTGDGISEDDIGSAVKFNYTKSSAVTKWRTPRKQDVEKTAHFNEGYRTEKKDNKANISYGERESWYLQSIESKAFVAIFTTDSRHDAKGVISAENGKYKSENVNKKLSRIDLYTKAEIKSKGINNAIPVKSVFFEYDYSLCKGAPGNDITGDGKLTLKSVYFSYNGQERQSKDRYVFGYNETSVDDNPDYAYASSDRWGMYKPAVNNPAGISNIDYSYSDTSKERNDQNAGVWSLKKILLPSGGEMGITYEADDYAYVQNKRASNMFGIYGFGTTKNYSDNNSLYNGSDVEDNLYVYVHLPEPLINTETNKAKGEILAKYLDGLEQLCFKLQVQMPRGLEPLTVYSEYDDYGVCTNSPNRDYIYIRMKAVDGKSPLATSAIGFLTNNLPGQAFPGYEAEVDNLADFLNLAGNMLSKLTEAFRDANTQMRDAAKARTVSLNYSFVRLTNPYRKKMGGGVRVKRITLKDNWNRMTGKYDATYGQDYEYTTTENVNGKEITISSGVATYEPGIGSEENPFRNALLVKNKLPAASAQYGAIETPVVEGLFPAPSIGYSKITVRSINRNGTRGDSVFRSAVGKQVTEFYTAKDFPVKFSHTPLLSIDYHKNPLLSFFYKEIVDSRAVSQGFLVETNDMHGKMKSQAAYSESDEKTPLTGTYYSYINTGQNGFNDKVDFIYKDSGFAVSKGNMGIDVELMSDVREFSVKSSGTNIQAQVDIFPVIFPFTIPTAYVLETSIKNLYRAVTCTKLINYHAILDTVVAIDKGSSVKTVTTAYDAETGSPVISMTFNEFNDPVYNVSLPAWWAYSGMGPACKNIGARFSGVNFYDGKIITAIDSNLIQGGDELLVISQDPGSTGCIGASDGVKKLWAFDLNKVASPLSLKPKSLYFMDINGNLFTGKNVTLKVIRSGNRNLLDQNAGSFATLSLPIENGIYKVSDQSKVTGASVTEFAEKWQADPEAIFKRNYYYICNEEYDSIACNGILEKKINPYVKGLLGNFKPKRNFLFYGDRNNAQVQNDVNLRANGYIASFTNFWKITGNHLFPNDDIANWVWTSELTRLNAQSQPLEVRDALNRYKSTQYGFKKFLPVAETQNSEYGQSFYESFEDASLNKTQFGEGTKICNQPLLDLTSMPYGTIVNRSTEQGITHSGDYSLAVAGGSKASKQIPLKSSVIKDYGLTPQKEIRHILSLNTPGGNNISFNGSSYTSFNFQSSYVPGEANYQVHIQDFNDYGLYDYTWVTSHYREFTSQGWYEFEFSMEAPYLTNFIIAMNIYNGEDQLVGSVNYNQINSSFTIDTLMNLCSGIYRIEISMGEYFDQYQWHGLDETTYYNFYIKDESDRVLDINAYATLQIEDCEMTLPISGKDSLLNPTFSIKPGEKMLFSTWVKESCGVPCFKNNFDSAYVILDYNVGKDDTLKAKGNIIEGWQRIEGTFSVPANATSLSLKFNNTASDTAYFDDVRIHPFHALMKSYVFDPVTLRLAATLDENSYATFYNYDEEGQLVRIKKETERGIETIKESRSAKQRAINSFQ